MTFRYIPFKLNSQKRNALSRTSEREFDREIKKIYLLQESTARIQESAKKCIKAHSARAKCENDLAEGLQGTGVGKDDKGIKRLVDLCLQAAQEWEAQAHDLNATLLKTMVEPMKRYSNLFPAMQAAIKKREQSLQDFTKCQEKVEKYLKRERTGLNAVKLENSRKACATAKLEFDGVNDALLEDIQTLYRHRTLYFHPCLQAFVAAENDFYRTCENIHANSCRHLSKAQSHKHPPKLSTQSSKEHDYLDEQDEDQIVANINKRLAEIKALSITVDDR